MTKEQLLDYVECIFDRDRTTVRAGRWRSYGIYGYTTVKSVLSKRAVEVLEEAVAAGLIEKRTTSAIYVHTARKMAKRLLKRKP